MTQQHEIDTHEKNEMVTAFLTDTLLKASFYRPEDEVMSLLDTKEGHDEIIRIINTDYLLEKTTPLWSLDELKRITRMFINYLKAEKASLIEIGYPQKFLKCKNFLDFHLTNLFPMERKDGMTFQEEVELFLEPQNEEEKIKKQRLLGHYDLLQNKLESGIRELLFQLKIDILEILHDAIFQTPRINILGECLEVIRCSLKTDQMKAFLKLESMFLGHDIETGKIFRTRDIIHPGGLTDLLYVMAHYESELKFMTMHNTRNCLGDLVKLDVNRIPRLNMKHYFDVLPENRRKILDNMLANFEDASIKASNYKDEIYKRFFDELDVIEFMQPFINSSWFEVFMCNKGYFLKGQNIQNIKKPEKYVFRIDDKKWDIRFEGKFIPVRSTPGLYHIAFLLKQAQSGEPQPVFVKDLDDAYKRMLPKNINNVQDKPIVAEDGKAQSQYLYTWNDIKKYEAHVEILDDQMRSMPLNSSPEIIIELKSEKEKLEKVIKRAKFIRKKTGKPERFSDDEDKCRKRVSARILRVLKKITEIDDVLGQHLDQALKIRGYYWVYIPNSPITWLT